MATIVTNPKGEKDSTIIENRRPISLLDGFSKITERILKNKIEIVLEERELIPGKQFVFRQGLGGVQQALNRVQDVKEKTDPWKVAVAALIDVEKAYDKVWSPI